MLLESYYLPSHTYIQHQGYSGHICQQRAASIANKRQGYTGYRHQPYGHSYVLKYMEQEHCRNTYTNKHAVVILGHLCYVYAP